MKIACGDGDEITHTEVRRPPHIRECFRKGDALLGLPDFKILVVLPRSSVDISISMLTFHDHRVRTVIKQGGNVLVELEHTWAALNMP